MHGWLKSHSEVSIVQGSSLIWLFPWVESRGVVRLSTRMPTRNEHFLNLHSYSDDYFLSFFIMFLHFLPQFGPLGERAGKSSLKMIVDMLLFFFQLSTGETKIEPVVSPEVGSKYIKGTNGRQNTKDVRSPMFTASFILVSCVKLPWFLE